MASPRFRSSPLGHTLIALLVAAPGLVTDAYAKDSTAGSCPDVSGHYRVAGFSPALADALKALRASSAGFTSSEVKFSGRAEDASACG
jgi:hypothetical protein